MNISELSIRRPVATTLLTVGLALSGLVALFLLPVSPLPNVDIPTIFVSATMPGASPETMATSVATPLERHLGTIASVTEMTSQSSAGSTRITLQFDLGRAIDGAARDVQAAINAARVDLPSSLRSNPAYRRTNPAEMPILVMALTSKTLTRGQLYDAATTVLQQRLSQVDGVGDVQVSGSSLPAVRVELNPRVLFNYGIGLEDVRAALAAANANSPKGAVEGSGRRYQLTVNDTAKTASEYRNLMIAYRGGAAVRLSSVAKVVDGVENVHTIGLANGVPAVLLIVSKQPGANVVETVDQVRALMPTLRASLPPSIRLDIVNDLTPSIRASIRDVERTLMISTVLVLAVVFFFLRNAHAALIPSIAVPLSLIGTFGVMYLLGFSLDNLSLMALTVAAGFVVDDAIVVLENVMRHIESGVPRLEAALLGAREVGFTVLAMSLSLIAVFVPILLMGGLVGRFFHEFAVTLSVAILLSLLLSLTTTAMMCAYLPKPQNREHETAIARAARRSFDLMQGAYERTLGWSLSHPLSVMLALVLTVVLNFYLFIVVPKGFFPQQDTGTLSGRIVADEGISYRSMRQKFARFVKLIGEDPAVANVVGFTGGGGGGPAARGGGTNTGNLFVQLRPLAERNISDEAIIARLRPRFSKIAGARLTLRESSGPGQGGRQSNARYQFTIEADTFDELKTWAPRITTALQNVAELSDVNSDQEDKGLEVNLAIDRATASRLGLSVSQIDSTLYDAFGQRQVSTIYQDLNQYHVVMEVAPEFSQVPEVLNQVYVSKAGGAISGTEASAPAAGTTVVSAAPATVAQATTDPVRNQQTNAVANTTRASASTGAAVSTAPESMIPLTAVAKFKTRNAPLVVNHHGPFAATTFSFNLAEGTSLLTAMQEIERAIAELHMPPSLHGEYAGEAKQFQQSLANEPLLILAAILTVYIVLGILYESFVHPLTILSTLPSAGVGAVLALLVFGTQFSLISLVGVILLIGIVKKNAIMMIDFALQAERDEGLGPRESIEKACLLRFRPIMMTTFAAILGALPLALMTGEGAAMRQPLGISIVGGLVVSQILTLYTTPIVYLYLDKFNRNAKRVWTGWLS